ncbi:C40 family peptidase [Daejeonella oryzae]|uniref:C40 family peptidase n=1 Tax=Daejeonella oryzae TaxID=1122943 RepID=UPI0004038945|nr:C40 family peptidase [Daejeonella oryzae]
MKLFSVIFLASALLVSCGWGDNTHYTGGSSSDTINHENKSADTFQISGVKEMWDYSDTIKSKSIKTGNTNPDELVSFANTLTGIPYKYGSINPNEGFDCSGFITYVFNRFGIAVPRSSKDFNEVERKISLKESKPGDLILFTGTDSTIREVGHMGIIASNDGSEIRFIHSTSGKAYGVTTTPLNKYYQGRFVKALRIFNSNNN